MYLAILESFILISQIVHMSLSLSLSLSLPLYASVRVSIFADVVNLVARFKGLAAWSMPRGTAQLINEGACSCCRSSRSCRWYQHRMVARVQ